MELNNKNRLLKLVTLPQIALLVFYKLIGIILKK